MRLALIDNYDSFTYNLVHYFESIVNTGVDVFRSDKVSLKELAPYSHICISPGPGLPHEAGITLDTIKTYSGEKNILGVCLGMQAMAIAFGGELINLERVQHGVMRTTYADNADKLFYSMPSQFLSGRYHSWAVSPHNLPAEFKITATDDDNTIMAFSNPDKKLYAVQFHPESVLTENGIQILRNWLK